MLDSKPMLAGTPETRLDLKKDENPAILFHGLKNNLEIFGRWRDEAADSLDRLGNERGDLAAGARLDQVFDIIGAGDFAIGIFQAQRAAVAVRIDGMCDADADNSGFAPWRLRRHALGQ